MSNPVAVPLRNLIAVPLSVLRNQSLDVAGLSRINPIDYDDSGFNQKRKSQSLKGFAAKSIASPTVLIDHVIEVFTNNNGDEQVKVLTRQLVLERERPAIEKGL